MDFNDFTAGSDDVNRRLDKVLRKFMDSSKLSEIYKLIRKGLIKVNQSKSTPEYRIQNGDIINIASFLLQNSNLQKDSKSPDKKTNEIKLPEIVFENQHLLIVNKPYNINVHGESDSLDKIIFEYYNSINNKTSLSFQPGPLHRLDKKTTGLLTFSMSTEGAHWFTENIRVHNISKKYYGLVQGNLEKEEIWEDYIANTSEQKNGFAIVTASKSEIANGKKAYTVATPLAHGQLNKTPVTFVSFDIKTGRKHQIRSQSALHNHPLLGDTAYGGHKTDTENTKRDFYLQAYELHLPENDLKIPSELKIELDKDFQEMLKHCGIDKIGV